MRYKYKVRELGKEITEDMEAMSFKKLRRKLDPKKEYLIGVLNVMELSLQNRWT